jgi:hypothetical protein
MQISEPTLCPSHYHCSVRNQAQAKLLVEQNTVSSLTAHYEDLKAAQAHLANSYAQQQATINRLREDLDKVCVRGGGGGGGFSFIEIGVSA